MLTLYYYLVANKPSKLLESCKQDARNVSVDGFQISCPFSACADEFLLSQTFGGFSVTFFRRWSSGAGKILLFSVSGSKL